MIIHIIIICQCELMRFNKIDGRCGQIQTQIGIDNNFLETNEKRKRGRSYAVRLIAKKKTRDPIR